MPTFGVGRWGGGENFGFPVYLKKQHDENAFFCVAEFPAATDDYLTLGVAGMRAWHSLFLGLEESWN